MSVINVSYNDHFTGTNFELTKEIRSDHIAASLNAMVDVLRLMGFGDSLIRNYIGETYFENDYEDDDCLEDDDECCECCGCQV